MRDHLIEHLLAAEGPWTPISSLPTCDGLQPALRRPGRTRHTRTCPWQESFAQAGRQLLGQNVHLLAPTDPDHSLTDILYSRVGHDPDLWPQAIILANSRKLPALINAWPLPDLPSPKLRLTISHDWG